MTTDETPIPNEYYEQLIPLEKTIESVRESTTFECTLTTEEKHTARRLLHTTSRSLEEAREVLPGSNPGAEINCQREPDEYDDYEEALTHIERRLGRLLQYARGEHPDEYRYSDGPEDKFETALESIGPLRRSRNPLRNFTSGGFSIEFGKTAVTCHGCSIGNQANASVTFPASNPSAKTVRTSRSTTPTMIPTLPLATDDPSG